MIPVMNGVLTLILIVIFIGIWVWAWSGRNKAAFDQMARLPLEENETLKEDAHVK